MEAALYRAETSGATSSPGRKPPEESPIVPRDEVTVGYLGTARNAMGEATQTTARFLDSLEESLRRQAQEKARRLLRSVRSGGQELPEGETGTDGVPKGIWDRLLENAKDHPGAFGFGSAQEAADFLGDGSTVRVSTSFMLCQMSQPGDGWAGRPTVGVQYVFLTVPGGLAP